jgi:Protein of unknown function (DUF2946)
MLRRLLSILLFGATLFPTITLMLSTGAVAQSTLPACCRREGKHHCAMSDEERAMMMGDQNDGASKTDRMSAPFEKCPYSQHSLGAVHLRVFAPGAAAMQSVDALQKISAAEQAECLRRISFDRSRQKRGPPSLLS